MSFSQGGGRILGPVTGTSSIRGYGEEMKVLGGTIGRERLKAVLGVGGRASKPGVFFQTRVYGFDCCSGWRREKR